MTQGETSSRWWQGRWVRRGALVLVCAAVMLAGAVVVARARSGAPTGASASASAGGLTYTLRITPGPYFLREFTVVQLALANHGHTTYQIGGACGEPLSVDLAGGSGPTYTLPLPDSPFSCPGPMPRPFAPGQSWTATVYLPLTVSGDATLTAHVGIATETTGADGITNLSMSDGPFTGHLPTLHLAIAPGVPSNRVLSIGEATYDGAPVVAVHRPTSAQGNVYILNVTSCGDREKGPYTMGISGWQHIQAMSYGEPSCPGPNEVWGYAIAAPGYAIESGTIPHGARL